MILPHNMTVKGICRVKTAYHRLRVSLEHRVIILMYHRIFEATSDPWKNCVTPKHFTEHLAHLRGHHRIISLRTLASSFRAGRLPRRAVVLTLDDGYVDNFDNAKPLLERYETPATFFVTTGYVGEQQEFWWDDLERSVLLTSPAPPTLSVTVRGERREWRLADDIAPAARLRVYREIYNVLNPLAHDERASILQELRALTRGEAPPRPGYRPLTPDEVCHLEESGLVEIGSHSVTHPRLSAQPLDAQLWELTESKKCLENMLGHPVTSFCYPYGSWDDVGRDAVDLAAQAGFDVACSSCAHPVTSVANPFWLPRFAVLDWDGTEFASRIDSMFGRAPGIYPQLSVMRTVMGRDSPGRMI